MDNKIIKSEKLTRQDYESIFMLVILYSIQGCILGFFNYTLLVILAEKNVLISKLAPLTFSAYPYTFKILLAPFVDSYYWPNFGKRKSYIVPVQYLLSFLMFITSMIIQYYIDSQQIIILTIIGIVLCFLISLQDVAVDGWAIKLFKPQNIYYGSISQSMGMGLGFVTSTALYFLLADIKQENQVEGFFNASFYFLALAVFLLILTLYVHLMVTEKTEQIDFQIQEISAKKGLLEIYSVFVGFFKNRHLRYLLIFVLIDRWGFSPIQSVDNLIFVQNGVKKESLSKITMLLSPMMFVFPIVMAKYLKKYLQLWFLTYLMIAKLILQFFRYILLQVPGENYNQSGIYLYLLILSGLLEFWHFSQFILIRNTFFNIIASKGFESTYVTSLGSANNLGRQIGDTLFLAIFSYVNFELAVGIGWIYSAILIYVSANRLEELSNLKKKEWDIIKLESKGELKESKEE